MNRQNIASIIIIAAALSGLAAATFTSSASAKITPGTPPSCENKGGSLPPGQQPNCHNDNGLTQNPGTCASNPADKCPPGQNK